MQHKVNRSTMIPYVQPVPDILTIAVDWNLLLIHYLGYGQRNKLFREMIWPIIVRTACDIHRQTKRLMVSANQEI
ncbi:hypothetical protein D3C73_1620530 [compost metagenome]